METVTSLGKFSLIISKNIFTGHGIVVFWPVNYCGHSNVQRSFLSMRWYLNKNQNHKTQENYNVKQLFGWRELRHYRWPFFDMSYVMANWKIQTAPRNTRKAHTRCQETLAIKTLKVQPQQFLIRREFIRFITAIVSCKALTVFVDCRGFCWG